LNQSSTSASTRKEIGFFVVGSTTEASAQKSSGNSASSDGDVARIVLSDIRRSLARSARPRSTRLLRDGFLVGFTLTAVTLAGSNDSSIDVASGPSPIGIDDGERNALGPTQCDHPLFPVVPARVRAFQCGAVEDLGRELKVESAFPEVSIALASIPHETHLQSIRLYIHTPQVVRRRGRGLVLIPMFASPRAGVRGARRRPCRCAGLYTPACSRMNRASSSASEVPSPSSPASIPMRSSRDRFCPGLIRQRASPRVCNVIGMCEATKPAADEVISVAKP